MHYNKEKYEELFNQFKEELKIKESTQSFKIKLFLEKATNSLLIAKHHKEILPNKDQPEKIHWNYWAITISYYSMLYATKAAILSKGYEVNDHFAAQIALGYLLVPDKIEKEDLELLDQAHKIFEDEYIKYFSDARTESHTARYRARPSYTTRKVDEIISNAAKFVQKIILILDL